MIGSISGHDPSLLTVALLLLVGVVGWVALCRKGRRAPEIGTGQVDTDIGRGTRGEGEPQSGQEGQIQSTRPTRLAISVTIPGELPYRWVVLRAAEAACKLVREAKAGPESPGDLRFEAEVVSAVGEAFNNVVMHGYRGRSLDAVCVDLEPDDRGLVVRMRDHGAAFDPTAGEVRRPRRFSEWGMGLFIIRSFMDSMAYQAGRPPHEPNVLRMEKRVGASQREELR